MRKSYALNLSKTPKQSEERWETPPQKKNLNCIFRDFAGNSFPKKILPFLAAENSPQTFPILLALQLGSPESRL